MDNKDTKTQCLNIDWDAYRLLHTLCPTGRGIGRLVSELIRREARERDERARMVARLAAQLVD